MANRTSTLYIRVTKNGRNSFCKPVYLSKGRLKPHYAVVEGEPEHHPEGVYYIRSGSIRYDHWQVLGLDASGAGFDPRSGGFAGSPFPLSVLPTIQTVCDVACCGHATGVRREEQAPVRSGASLFLPLAKWGRRVPGR
jgi:hypothetical protein